MGEDAGNEQHVDPGVVWFIAHAGSFTRQYPGPYDLGTADGIADFYWDVGFVVGYVAAQGYSPRQVTIQIYKGDKLIWDRNTGTEAKPTDMTKSYQEKLRDSQHKADVSKVV